MVNNFSLQRTLRASGGRRRRSGAVGGCLEHREADVVAFGGRRRVPRASGGRRRVPRASGGRRCSVRRPSEGTESIWRPSEAFGGRRRVPRACGAFGG
ncbi:hypothetical protein N9L68_02870, partial [bacterium]|nr:hypothetical protein [bacterium]